MLMSNSAPNLREAAAAARENAYALRGGKFIDAVSMARLANLPQSGKEK